MKPSRWVEDGEHLMGVQSERAGGNARAQEIEGARKESGETEMGVRNRGERRDGAIARVCAFAGSHPSDREARKSAGMAEGKKNERETSTWVLMVFNGRSFLRFAAK